MGTRGPVSRRGRLCLLLSVLWVCSGTAFGQLGPFTIAVDGKPQCVIVVPVPASETIQFAARQLATYLTQITGAEFAAVPVTELGKRKALYVGAMPVAGKVLEGNAQSNPEAFTIDISPASITIVGSSDRATLYGVYRFLEEDIGCRWLTPDIEHVPSRPTLHLAAMRRATAPAFDMRTFIARGKDDQVKWGTKMGMN